MLENIHKLSHASFRIDGTATVYIDPFHLDNGPKKADLILISHDHYDHCSVQDIEKIQKPETVILATASCKSQLSGEVHIVKPGDHLTIKQIRVEVVPAYNTNKKFHPKESGFVGYVFTIEGLKIYFAGDTDVIPEMKEIQCDVALLPVSGTYVMTAEEAVEAARLLRPQVVIPMHYGDIVGTLDDAKKFKKLYQGKTEIK